MKRTIGPLETAYFRPYMYFLGHDECVFPRDTSAISASCVYLAKYVMCVSTQHNHTTAQHQPRVKYIYYVRTINGRIFCFFFVQASNLGGRWREHILLQKTYFWSAQSIASEHVFVHNLWYECDCNGQLVNASLLIYTECVCSCVLGGGGRGIIEWTYLCFYPKAGRKGKKM